MMKKPKRKLSKAQKLEKKRRKQNTEIIFINGKQKRVPKRSIEGIPEDEFIEKNADPIFLMEQGMYELLDKQVHDSAKTNCKESSDDIPF